MWIIWQRAPDTVVCFIDEYYLEVNAAVSIFIKYPEQLVKEHFPSISLGMAVIGNKWIKTIGPLALFNLEGGAGAKTVTLFLSYLSLLI